MPDQDQDAFEEGQPNEFVPGEDDFEDEFEDGEEEAPEEAPARTRAEARAEAAAAAAGGRRFRLGRGGDEELEQHVQGSLRAAHERIRVDDRASAVFALLCAIGLVGILAGGYLGQYVPKAAVKPLETLGLETFKPAPSASGSATLAPTTSPTASPSASPTASPSAS